jgi:hypothetical protein
MAEPQDNGVADIDDNMPLVGVFPCCIQRMTAPIGPTLVKLGNKRRIASKRPPRRHMVSRNNRNRDSRTVQSNISFPHLVDAISTIRIELPEGSTRGNRGGKQSNPSILPFLETYTPGGASCTPIVASHRGPEASNAEDPLVPRVKRLVWTNVGSTNTIELRHETSKVEGEVKTTFGDEDDVEGDDEHEDNDGNVCKEAPNDPDICIQQPLRLDSSFVCRLDRLRSAPNTALKEDE